MNVAEAKYTGRGRSTHRKAPSGRTFMLRRYPGNDDEELPWVGIEHAEDAEWLSEQPNIEVRWKPLGRLRAASDDAVSALSELGYKAKQRLVGADGFDLDVAGNASEDELEEALREHIDQLDEGEL